jgi:transposase
MAMGTRKQREKQEGIWIAHTELAAAPGHPFYQKLNELLEAEGFDEFVEGRCAKFYAAKYGRPSLTPGIYFRSLLIGYFEGIGAERGIAWRLADSLALRRFVGIGLDENTADHSTISRTRRLIDVDTHREVFGWVLGVLADRGLVHRPNSYLYYSGFQLKCWACRESLPLSRSTRLLKPRWSTW